MNNSHISTTAQQRLRDFLEQTKNKHERFIGFPCALDFDYSELTPLLHRLLNNIGDPYVETVYSLGSKPMERQVLDFFANLFRAPTNDWWGYITNGSTECNLFALYIAREKYPKATVYYSDAAHYSVPKNIHILAQKGVAVAAAKHGEMDYSALKKQLLKDKARQAIIVATIGTTMTEARDDVAKIRQALQEANVKEYFIHSDAALCGPYMNLVDPDHPFDFTDGADSVSISGHKFIGSPVPCGVVIVRKQDRDLLGARINYTGSVDATITGSRNGHTPLFMWYAIERWGKEGLKKRAEEGLAVADYAHKQLQKIGWPSWRNRSALTVMLAAPPQELTVKWQLATHQDWSHIICMPGVTKDKVDRFIADLLPFSGKQASGATAMKKS